jgi:GT2 family glycosyltransferase
MRSVRDNEFVRRTLQSLQEQTILPEEIIIVIPADIEPWDTGIPGVRFIQAKRGMVTQRAAGIVAAKNKYLLLLDDDVVLARDTSELLLNAIYEQNAECIVPHWNETRSNMRIVRVLLALFGISIAKKTGGVYYTAGGGFYYPEQKPTGAPWDTQGGAGAVIMVNSEFCIKNACLGDESLQEISVYALREDGAFILDIFRNGGRCMMIGGVSFIHLGGTTKLDPSRLEMAFVAQIYNSYIFWKNYIKPQYTRSMYARLTTRLAFGWYLTGVITMGVLNAVRSKTFQPIRGIYKGMKFLFKKI